MKKYLFGNIKMNMSKNEIKVYAQQILKISKKSNNEVGVAFPFVYLPSADKYLNKSKVKYGVQNISQYDKGAYTGETSVSMIKDFNASFALVGHSERRALFFESNEAVSKKVTTLIENNVTPILCVGETLDERKQNDTKKIIRTQIYSALKDIENKDISKIFFAYEPVWAIGTGISASAKEANEVAKYIKQIISKKYEVKDVNAIKVLYGGSMNEKNYKELLGMSHIDGGLIGGACLDTNKFAQIISYSNK